jgi:hypothetical protein
MTMTPFMTDVIVDVGKPFGQLRLSSWVEQGFSPAAMQLNSCISWHRFIDAKTHERMSAF